jgi:hypothetical protein
VMSSRSYATLREAMGEEEEKGGEEGGAPGEEKSSRLMDCVCLLPPGAPFI